MQHENGGFVISSRSGKDAPFIINRPFNPVVRYLSPQASRVTLFQYRREWIVLLPGCCIDRLAVDVEVDQDGLESRIELALDQQDGIRVRGQTCTSKP